jgi:tetratricopeptide (TPR) repeat protein
LTGDEGGGGGDEYAQVEPERLPRQQGDEFINDYADDAYGELDLQADVYEAMFDVKEEMSQEQSQRLLLPPAADARAAAARAAQARRRRRPTKKLLRSVFARLFGKDVDESADGDDAAAPAAQGGYTGLTLASDDILRQVDRAQKAKGKSRLRVWFPTERNFPTLRGGGRRVAPQEAQQVLDVGGTALRFNLAEENASSRQQLGKALFAQGKYDAALAMFSLSVKIREDNGLRNAKTSAIAHTDVASSFIHLGDLRNAEKHLNVALEVYDKNTFSGGRQELGDVHCFLAVVAEMRGTLPEAEASYRRAIALYEEGGATKKNPNYTTARENLRDNLRRQRDGPALAAQQQEQRPAGEDASPVSTVDSDHATDKENSRAQQNAAAVYKPTPRSAIKSILRQSPGMKPLLAGPTPQTLSTINSFPGTDTMESACHGEARNTHSGARLSNSQLLDPASLASAPVHTAPDSMSLPPALDEFRRTAEFGGGRDGGGTPSAVRRSHRRSSRPTTWRALAEVARASMPTTPIDEADGGGSDGGEDSTLGSYEEMSRGWQRDGRKFLVEGSYTEAIDMYTLAIYTRKRHGPWSTKANAETHVEYARALFASKDVAGAAGALRDAITILEKLDSRKHDMMLGQVWGNFGSALDRLGGRALDAETAHSTGLVALTRAGLAKDAPPWAKAWKNLCVSVKAQGDKAKPIEKVWFAIDQQIRGVVPITSAATIKV